jgi:proteic killer suppression protein
MIKGFRDNWLRDFFLEDRQSKKIPANIRKRLFRKLQLLDDATCNLDLRAPPSNHFEKLANDQYRLLFSWNDDRGEADGVYLDDHSYK